MIVEISNKKTLGLYFINISTDLLVHVMFV